MPVLRSSGPWRSSTITPPNVGGAIVDAITSDPKERQAAALKGKYKGVASWLRIIARTARTEGIPADFQAAITVTEHTGVSPSSPLNWKSWNTKARSPAGAQGIAQFMPGTWAGEWNPWRNRSPLDPGVALQAQARFLRNLLRTYNGNALKAAEAYNGGPGLVGKSSETRAYAAQVQRAMAELKKDGVFGGGGLELDAPNASDLIPEPIRDITALAAEILTTILSPRKFADLTAKITAYFLRFIGRALWDYFVAPIWHWHQRATVYYFERIMAAGDKSTVYYRLAAFTTIGFWSVGYGILWARVDGDRALFARPTDTPLGSFVRSSRQTAARRHLTKPADVERNTPTKPVPVKSQATINQVDRISVHRNRPVHVRKGDSDDE